MCAVSSGASNTGTSNAHATSQSPKVAVTTAIATRSQRAVRGGVGVVVVSAVTPPILGQASWGTRGPLDTDSSAAAGCVAVRSGW